MSAADLAKDYLDVLIWPLLVVVVVLVFRKQLRQWFSRPPSRVKAGPGGVEAEWPLTALK